MGYNAQVYEVNSKDREIVLMPVGWETHSSPLMGDRPQGVINKQVLKDADLLVAVFWTRLGSPTGSSPSGTVEEIEEHIAAGKPAMIYFSSQPVQLDSVDPVQYEALKQFKQTCKSRGLIEEYESLEQFREKLTRQLAQTVIRTFSNDSNPTGPQSIVGSQGTQRPTISEAARELLVEASRDESGAILRIPTMGGLHVQVNGRDLVEPTPRNEAKWEGAVRELEQLGLIRDQGFKREVFQLTDVGYQTADSLVPVPRGPETESQRKARKILGMKDKIITLRWLNTPANFVWQVA